jgi:ABC-2 type transport system permease protein
VGERSSWVRRFFRQLAVAARMDLLVMITSKAQAALWLLTDFVAYTAGIAAVLLIAERFDGIAGWSKAQIVFLMGFAATSAALRQMFFGYNVAAISRRVGRGQLDHTLVQPQPVLLSFATEGFSPFSSLGALAPSAALLVVGTRAASLTVTPAFVAKTAVCLGGSMTLVLAATFAIGAAAFWAPRGAEEISTRGSSLLELTELPLDPLPVVLRGVLMTVVPAGFVAWYPAGVLVGRRPPEQWLLMPAVAALAAFLASLLFRKGLRHYAQTGSSRYSTFGHRR